MSDLAVPKQECFTGLHGTVPAAPLYSVQGIRVRPPFLFLSLGVYLTESGLCSSEQWHSTLSSPRATSSLSRCKEVESNVQTPRSMWHVEHPGAWRNFTAY